MPFGLLEDDVDDDEVMEAIELTESSVTHRGRVCLFGNAVLLGPGDLLEVGLMTVDSVGPDRSFAYPSSCRTSLFRLWTSAMNRYGDVDENRQEVAVTEMCCRCLLVGAIRYQDVCDW